ncbi:hypothetical protein LV457_03930 [Mycobacterium sp. MYCO198283]|uniref:hypothetical protein n=1 Tax=Mycobacterium sp. MYCO198283 TaxID=2883505 RepID=UPI001E495623|nr:hypothetical protein [Mycobacterium sp. MYCO198283]MCG5431439.1 hypothetical protein [Mycobacterium sp. MYCO198283]
MNTLVALLVLVAPFGITYALSRLARRDGVLRVHRGQFTVSAPMTGRLFDDPDRRRLAHELDAIRTRFETQPAWPVSGATGERR